MTRRGFSQLAPAWMVFAWLTITMAWWMLAFTRVAPAAPEWLARTQAVCFGTLANGLPDSYGWMNLIVPPLAMLGSLLTVYWRELTGTLRNLWSDRLGKVLLVTLLAAPIFQGGWVADRVWQGLAIEAARITLPERGDLPAGFPRMDRPAPDFRLVDQHGASVALSDLRGRVVYLTFAFGHCSATCPLVIRSMLTAARRTEGMRPHLLIVTLDPWRDTPGALPTLADKWQLADNGQILSGKIPEVVGVLDRYEVFYQRDLNTGDIGHPPLVYVIGPNGRIAYILNNPSPTWIAAAGRRAISPTVN